MSTIHDPTPSRLRPSVAEWKQIVAPHEEPSVWRASLQIVDTLGPYVTGFSADMQTYTPYYHWRWEQPYLIIQSTVMMVGGAAGVWLFYVHHQFEDAYWERREDWDYTAAALQGSSFID